MIGVKLKGRLGNQLFQYAFALALAKKTGQRFFIDQEKYAFDGRRYFELRSFNKYRNRFRQEWSKRFLHPVSQTEDQWLSPEENMQQFRFKHSFFNGYFQSAAYFSENTQLIRSELRLKDEVRIDARKHLSIEGKKYIALHLRRTDYIDFGSDELGGKNLVLPLSYYQNALLQIENLNEYVIVVVSDEIETVKEELDIPNALYTSDPEMIVDFQIIQQADIAVIANSSFSWWAAYLGNAKKVYAPKNWLGFKISRDYPIGTIPEKWEPLDVIPSNLSNS